jgi:tuftelin-interacting protein 11
MRRRQNDNYRLWRQIAGVLEQVRVDDATCVLNLQGLLLAFRDLKVRFVEEFKMCDISWITCQFARPLLIWFFHGWQPLWDPSVGLEVMSSWKDLLEGDEPCDLSHGVASMASYAQLANEVILPPVRVSGTNSWDAGVSEPTLDFLKTWEQVLPQVVLQLILEHVVVHSYQNLSALVESWDPCKENVLIHVWVHPWLPMLDQSSIEALCHSIRYKLRR